MSLESAPTFLRYRDTKTLSPKRNRVLSWERSGADGYCIGSNIRLTCLIAENSAVFMKDDGAGIIDFLAFLSLFAMLMKDSGSPEYSNNSWAVRQTLHSSLCPSAAKFVMKLGVELLGFSVR